MKNNYNGISLTLLGLIIAGIGVISPIAWDWWNKRVQITIETKSNVSIVSVSQPVKKLELLYDGKTVSELRKVILVMKNSGKTPVTKDDVVSPVTLAFTEGKLLEAVIVRKDPTNLGASATILGNSLLLGFELLNPSDEAEIEMLIAGSYSGFSANARIKNIKSIEITDPTQEKATWRNLGIGAYISGFFGIMFVLGGIGILLEIPRKKLAISLLRQRTSRVLNALSIDDAMDYLGKDFGFLTGVRKQRAINEISQHNYPLTDSSKVGMAEAIVGEIGNEQSLGPAIIMFILGGVALWYVISKFAA